MTRHGAVPNAEWVLMYRGGLTRTRIAALTRAPTATVGYHLAVAVAADPGLQAAHEQAAAKAPLRVSPQGLALMRELVAMVQETGRYPSRTAEEVGERTLASWLDRRRDDDAAGKLALAFRNGLAVLPDWQRPPRAVADEARWQDRLEALAEYRAAGHDWPLHKSSVAGEEHDLGVWLHSQRQKASRGELNPAKAGALDEAVPGWRKGRQRGRKPRNSTGQTDQRPATAGRGGTAPGH
ncbi:helicase associated domain-containing protein [Arthrobacter sp. ISL-65]|uniref:helicase associated domain-containing protein n=1 Tax=Arthrobacter sp. ISL-65 TaxID=2819112 RepID=UPI0027E13F6D|nr:helicase associated domain-containing protein [Arthrobacter sp. ISL-65]